MTRWIAAARANNPRIPEASEIVTLYEQAL